MDYTCTEFGVDSSSRFPFGVRTNKVTASDHPTHGSTTTGVGSKQKPLSWKYLTHESLTCYIIFTGHFSGLCRAIGPACMSVSLVARTVTFDLNDL